MEQLKQVGEFIWKWRFWFAISLAVIFGFVVQPVGTARVRAQVQARKQQLDGAYQQIQRYTGGVHPNPDWETKVKEKQVEADARVAEIQLEIYQKQAEKFVWPKVVADQFKGRPFNWVLDDENGRYLFLYYRNFDEYFKEIQKVVDPIVVNRDRTVSGKVTLLDSALERPNWNKDPDSQAVWLAQEQIWIQRALLESIAAINANAKNWFDAPIREVQAIRLGAGAIDGKKATEIGDAKLQMLPPVEGSTAPPPPPPTGGSESQGNVVERYLELSPDYRLIPVFVSLLVDQRELPEILSGLAATDFGFVVRQISWTRPTQRVQAPLDVEEFFNVPPGVSKEAEENTVQLVVLGEMIIYQMPPTERQKWDEEQAKLKGMAATGAAAQPSAALVAVQDPR